MHLLTSITRPSKFKLIAPTFIELHCSQKYDRPRLNAGCLSVKHNAPDKFWLARISQNFEIARVFARARRRRLPSFFCSTVPLACERKRAFLPRTLQMLIPDIFFILGYSKPSVPTRSIHTHSSYLVSTMIFNDFHVLPFFFGGFNYRFLEFPRKINKQLGELIFLPPCSRSRCLWALTRASV